MSNKVSNPLAVPGPDLLVSNPLNAASASKLGDLKPQLSLEPSFRPDPTVQEFSIQLSKNLLRYALDILLAVASPIGTMFNVLRTAGKPPTPAYLDGCHSTNTDPTADNLLPLYVCAACNGDVPTFGAQEPSPMRFLVFVYSLLAAVWLAGAAYGLRVRRTRANHMLAYGVYVSKTGRSTIMLSLVLVFYLVLTAFVQAVANSMRRDLSEGASLGPNGHCPISMPDGLQSYANATLLPFFSKDNPTAPPRFEFSVLPFLYFLYNVGMSQQSTMKDLLLGPSDVYSDASLRVSLKSKAVIRAVQAHVRWQVLAKDIDASSRFMLTQLTAEEHKKRNAARPLVDKFIRGFFWITGVLFLDLYSCQAAYVGVNPWDRTYRKPEWEGRTLVEQLLHRLYKNKKIDPMRQNRDPTAVMAATPHAPSTPRVSSRPGTSDASDTADADAGFRISTPGSKDGRDSAASASSAATP